MVRARLASLTLAGSLLATASGCCNLSEGFRLWRPAAAAPECTCNDMGALHGATVPTSIQVPTSGPVLVSPETMPFTGPPPSATPMGPPPRIMPIPATPMPWTGQN